jgi:hypothetical protein
MLARSSRPGIARAAKHAILLAIAIKDGSPRCAGDDGFGAAKATRSRYFQKSGCAF